MAEYWGAGRGVAPTDWGVPLKPRPPLSPFPPTLARGYRVSLLFRVFIVGSLPSGQGAHMVPGAVLRPTPDTMRAPTPSAPCVGSRCVLTVRYVLMRGHPAAPLGRLAPRTRALPPTHFTAGFCGESPRYRCGTLSFARSSMPALRRGSCSFRFPRLYHYLFRSLPCAQHTAALRAACGTRYARPLFKIPYITPSTPLNHLN